MVLGLSQVHLKNINTKINPIIGVWPIFYKSHIKFVASDFKSYWD